jgi:hypothetical protein
VRAAYSGCAQHATGKNMFSIPVFVVQRGGGVASKSDFDESDDDIVIKLDMSFELDVDTHDDSSS